LTSGRVTHRDPLIIGFSGLLLLNAVLATRLANHDFRHGDGSNAKLKAQGEGRLLAVIPDSPLITWDSWKSVPTHFIQPE
jgi:hypothetical protein